MSRYEGITKECPFCGLAMYICDKEKDTTETIDYMCTSCGFVASFMERYMTKEERNGVRYD